MAARKKGTPKSETRAEILEQSILLFAKSGYDGVSMRDVAAAVGVTPAAIYYHFSDKEQLYLDTLEHALKEKAGGLYAALDGKEKRPWARLEAFVGALTEVLTQEKDFQRLLQWVFLDRDDQRLQKLGNKIFKDVDHQLGGFSIRSGPWPPVPAGLQAAAR
jgi:AcrR family transcriptional regulator